MKRTSMLVGGISAAWLVAMAGAQPALVTVNTTLAPGATVIRDATTNTDIPLATADITVRGVTLTINGEHAIRSLTLERSAGNQPGVVTHTAGFTYDADPGPGVRTVNGLSLSVSGNVVVQGANGTLVGSSIHANGRGFASMTGPGAASDCGNTSGAGHGGRGAAANGECHPGGAVYGLYNLPTEMGSGGYVGNGGGAVRLTVGGIIFNDGSIEANGASNGAYCGGAGGSVLLVTVGLQGTGSVRANGSDSGFFTNAASPGGGRVAIYGTSSSFGGTIQARSGNTSKPGGAGTIYLNAGNGSRAELIIDNADVVAGITELPSDSELDVNLRIRNQGRLGPVLRQSGMNVRVAGNITVEADGFISGTGIGHVALTGPGSASDCGNTSGASYGGRGAASDGECHLGGAVYGLFELPTEMGSGGYSGPGGGAIRLAAAGVFTHDGTVECDGITQGNYAGGSGGSVLLSGASFVGSGSIRANGAGSGFFTNAAAAGGGRVAVYGVTGGFTGSVEAHGGSTNKPGGAGTIYLSPGAGQRGELIIDNADLDAGITELPSDRELDVNLTIRNKGRLGPVPRQPGMNVRVAGDVTVESDGYISATGSGYVALTGPGAANACGSTSGASFGGRGAASNGECHLGGATYGVLEAPVEMGSGGYSGPGGGAIRVIAAGVFTHDGTVDCDGTTQGNYCGGSGGSVLLSGGTFRGSGTIHANGAGSGFFTDAAAPGGGRIAVLGVSGDFTGTVLARGGSTAKPGGAGTVYLLPDDGGRAQVIIDNGDVDAGITELPGDRVLDADLRIRNKGKLGPVPHEPMQVQVTGNIVVEADGIVSGTGLGYNALLGPGAADACGGTSGASHGGRGTASSNGCDLGGPVNGLFSLPTEMGSGGYSGPGGGALRLTAAGTIFHDGLIESDGVVQGNYCGGAGGSVLLVGTGIEGEGTIRANGAGSGFFADAAAPGGGRIALHGASAAFTGLLQARGGITARPGGAGTIYLQPNDGSSAELIIDNAGTAAGITELPNGVLDANLRVRGGARLGHELGVGLDLSISGDVTIESGASISATGLGYGPLSGPGAANACGGTSGAGYGGAGRAAAGGCHPGGAPYGSLTQPMDFGSGGYSGPGGGAIRLDVAGTLECDGVIAADGTVNGPYCGGSGGSINLVAASVTGSGLIHANGAGTGFFADASSPGGGRIAIYSCDMQVPLSNIVALAGPTLRPGQPGTIYFGSSSVEFQQQPVGGDFASGDYIQLNVQATGSGPVTYQWRKQNTAGEFIELNDGDLGLYTETTTDTLFISAVYCAGGGNYDCLVCDSCGCFPSQVATLNLNASGDFNQDGGVDGSDVDAFFADWEAGLPTADTNNDGGVDGVDVTFFFLNWEGGC